MSAFLISRDEMIAEQIRIFDQLRTGTQVCYLIAHNANSKTYSIIRQLESGWFVSWDKFREQFLLRYATLDEDFADQSDGSFFAYGTPDADADIDIYAVKEDEHDRVPPTETSPSWKFFLTRVKKERFRIPSRGFRY